MVQHDKEFVPYVLPIYVGTHVTFPNRDDIRHDADSFSSVKRFELPLYIGTPAAPVVFDKPGVVALGCSIHDWMLAYIYVLTTPYSPRPGPMPRRSFVPIDEPARDAPFRLERHDEGDCAGSPAADGVTFWVIFPEKVDQMGNSAYGLSGPDLADRALTP